MHNFILCPQIPCSAPDVEIIAEGLFSYTPKMINYPLSRVHISNEHSEEPVFYLIKHKTRIPP